MAARAVAVEHASRGRRGLEIKKDIFQFGDKLHILWQTFDPPPNVFELMARKHKRRTGCFRHYFVSNCKADSERAS